jgi:hypothetical protein
MADPFIRYFARSWRPSEAACQKARVEFECFDRKCAQLVVTDVHGTGPRLGGRSVMS